MDYCPTTSTQAEHDAHIAYLNQRFAHESHRWHMLCPGDFIYTRGEDTDVFRHEVVSVDPKNRKLICKDHSLGGVLVEVRERWYFREECEAANWWAW